MTETQKWYDGHLAEYQKVSYIKSMEEYKELYRQSIEEVDTFWAEQARKYLIWAKEWDFVLDYDFTKGKIAWFGGGVLNATYNCLDRHQETMKNKVAYYWEGDSPEEKN